MIVFRSFTWQHFLVVAVALICLWYGLVLPWLYRGQVRQWLDKGRKKTSIEPIRKEWQEELEEEPVTDTDEGLLGRPVLPAGMSRLETNMFGFAPDIDDESRELQQGLLPDVMEELKSIFHILETESGGKADFISLFGLVKSKYAAVRGTPSQRALNDYIRENALFPISDDELTNLWN